MVKTYNKTRVYREDWDFEMDELMGYFFEANDVIHNDDWYGVDTYDFIEIDDFNLCKELDDAFYTMEYGLFELLSDRLQFEFDMDNTVLNTMEGIIKAEWNESEDWEDVIRIIKGVKDGWYDNDMRFFYTYLQAIGTLENLWVLDFGEDDGPFGIEETLKDNNILLYDEVIEFDLMYTRVMVKRTDDLEDDVRRLLDSVVTKLKNMVYYTSIKDFY